MMTDEQIELQIMAGARDSLIRFRQTIVGKVSEGMSPELRRRLVEECVISEYLSGISQSMHFLAIHDGELTAQRILKCVTSAADKLGFCPDVPRDPSPPNTEGTGGS